MNNELLRLLPMVDEVLTDERISSLMERIPRNTVVGSVRSVIDSKRQQILDGLLRDEKDLGLDSLAEEIIEAAETASVRSLRPVVNATGVVLHTNLGRANLSEDALKQVMSVATSYSTIEYDPEKGARGSRHDHIDRLVTALTEAEAAVVVNNNAAATMLTLAALGRGKEIIVSRGELVEIGGSFRIPDIMEESGAHLVEVGTTNKTKIKDYEYHITENTAALMKVHTSNYRIIGFTEDTSVAELRKLGDRYGLPVIYDMGSGLMTDLTAYGIVEPVVKKGLEEGADLVLFSGDKMLGGPQAGIIAGRKDLIDKIKVHPLARAFRVDKLTIAAMEATLNSYFDTDKALHDIPVLRMLTRSFEDLRADASELKLLIDEITGPEGELVYAASVIEDEGVVGGGSAPQTRLRNAVVTVTHPELSPDRLEALLREGVTPIVARIRNDKLILDVRTLGRKDFDTIAARLREIAES
ncbi:MAG: L-seryl-tRNA(Sec) selenium transferase [Firmicutes bacterium]|nr:L-seryl-tRNA(Sec) selenium transferase [Bacillota bacterium]